MTNNDDFMPKTLGEELIRLQQMYAGLTSPQCTLTSLTVNMVTYAKADLAKVVLGWITVFTAVNQALTAYHDAVKTRNAAEPTVRAFMENFLMALQQIVGDSESALALYGFRPKKEATPLTAFAKAAKVQKTLETREKNHTLGQDQKKPLDKGGTPGPGNAGSGTKT